MTPVLATDIASSLLAGLGCIAVVWWIARTPGRSFLERRSIPILANLGAVYLLRVLGWYHGEGSVAHWLAFIPATLNPLVFALLVEGLLRRHLPRWLKLVALGMTLYFVVSHLMPVGLRHRLLDLQWPAGMMLIMALLARQLWVDRNAGLSREERRLIAGVTVIAIIGIPLVLTDGRSLVTLLPNRVGGIAGLLLARVLLTPPATDGLRDTILGVLRVLGRGATLAALVTVALLEPTVESFLLALTLSMAALLLFEVVDRLRRRQRSEIEHQLLHWLASAPGGSFDDWRRALRHAPLMADAIVLEGEPLARYDQAAIGRLFAQLGPLLSETDLRLLLARRDAALGASAEQLLDLLSTYELTHIGLLGDAPLRLVGASVPEVGGRESTLRLKVILRTGQDAVRRGALHA